MKKRQRTGDLTALVAGLDARERLPFVRAIEVWVSGLVERQGNQLERLRRELHEWEQYEERSRGAAAVHAADQLAEFQRRIEDGRRAVANFEAERARNAEQLATLQAWIAEAMKTGAV